MSIRGIDTQIMITRTADFARETSSVQRQPEVTQDFLAVQSKIESAQDQSRVAATNESEMENIRTDKDGAGSGAEGGEGSKQGEEEMTEEQKKELLVAPAPYDQLIDIHV
jgi:hypothetical protein